MRLHEEKCIQMEQNIPWSSLPDALSLIPPTTQQYDARARTQNVCYGPTYPYTCLPKIGSSQCEELLQFSPLLSKTRGVASVRQNISSPVDFYLPDHLECNFQFDRFYSSGKQARICVVKRSKAISIRLPSSKFFSLKNKAFTEHVGACVWHQMPGWKVNSKNYMESGYS